MNLEDTLAITPLSVDGEVFEAFGARIRRHAAANGEETALVEGTDRVSWAGLGRAMDETMGRLCRAGLRSGDVVAIAGEPSVGYMVAYLAVLAGGGCVAPLPLMAADTSLAAMIADSGATILLGSDMALERFDAIVSSDPRLQTITRLALESGLDRWIRLADVAIARGAAPEVPPDALFNIIYSSGTTGVPKGIVHDQLFRCRQAERMGAGGLRRGKVMLASTAMYSNTTLVAALAALGNGATLVLMRKFDVADFLAVAARERATHAMLVPIQCRRILDHPGFRAADLASLEYTIVTSSPFTTHGKDRMAAIWPGDLWEMYGLTEGGLTTMLDVKRFPDKRATVGRPPATARIRIVDEAGRELPVGAIGEVVGRSPSMMRGYHGRPDLTSAALVRLADGDVYLRTGDLGRFDEDGFLSIVGRAKDVIISGGFNIYATDLEEALIGRPGVVDAAVIGVPDDVWGETPVGFVVVRPGETIDGAELLAATNRTLGRNQRLSALHIVDELPRNALGKVTKDVLRRTRAPAP